MAALAMPAMAEQGYTSFGCTNTVRSNMTVTVNLGNGLKIDNQDNAGIMVRAQGDAAGTGTITVTWARSHDNSNFETTPRFTTLLALNGNTAVLFYTNWSTAVVGAAGYIKPVSIANADTGANATNFTIWLVKKTVKPAP